MVIVIGVEHIRAQAESSFVRTISNVDLLVGARTSQINLLLYSVFRIGNATNNIRWESYEEIATRPEVSWSIPLSLEIPIKAIAYWALIRSTSNIFAIAIHRS